jgi:pimeloyl-ACP methyl ester carboxylesterase
VFDVVRKVACAWRRVLGVALVVGCANAAPARKTVGTPVVDPNRDEVQHFVQALSLDAPDTARRFSPEMRAGLPKLRSDWARVVAHNGALASFSIVGKDGVEGFERYHVELDFERQPLNALVVFQSSDGNIVGFFFQGPAGPPRGAVGASTASAPDPDVDELELKVGTAPLLLGASLTVPRKRDGARLPAVLFVGGSGANDRDETIAGMKPFRDLSHGLSRRNIVTLRFDKRTFTYPTHPAPTVEEEVIADAVSAAAVLRARPEVDPNRVFVLGHSLGALLAPEIATRSGRISGLVVIAAPGRPVTELYLEQLRQNGVRLTDLAPSEAKVKALQTLPPDEIVLGAPALYWQDLERRDEIAIARRLAVPVLYLRGGVDRQVFAEDQAAWSRAFADDARFEAVTPAGISHFLVPAGQLPGPELHVPDAVIAPVTAFIANSPPAP